MNIDRMIDANIVRLSDKYKISVDETRKYNDEFKRVTKSYIVNRLKKSDDSYNIQDYFKNKRELVSWLMCLN